MGYISIWNSPKCYFISEIKYNRNIGTQVFETEVNPFNDVGQTELHVHLSIKLKQL